MHVRVWVTISLSGILLIIATLQISSQHAAIAKATASRGCVRTPAGAPVPERTDLKDNVTHYAFLRRCAEGRPMVVTIDLVEYYEGKRAVREAAKDGEILESDVDPVVYVRNRNPKLRRLGVKPDAKVLMFDCSIPGCAARRVHLNALSWGALYRFRLQNGLIAYIELPYTP